MNNNDKLIENINEIINWIKVGGGFASEQAPLFINELLRYELTSKYINISFELILLILSLIVIIKCKPIIIKLREQYKPSLHGYEHYDISNELISIYIIFYVSCFSAFIVALCVIIDIKAIIKIYAAPKLFIFEYLQNLLN